MTKGKTVELLNVNLSNSERVTEVERVIKKKLEEGAEETQAFRKIVMKEVGGFTKREFEKAREVVNSGVPDNILVMNLRGLVSGYNRIAPKIKKKVEKKYSLSAKSSEIMRFIRHRWYNGQSVGDVIEIMFNDWAEDYITEYRNYTDEKREMVFKYKGAGDN